MNPFFKSLVPFCPRVHLALFWEAEDADETGQFIEHSAAVRATAIVNGEMLIGESDFVDGIPIFDGEEPSDEDFILSGQLEESCKEALEALKADMAEGLPIEREISAALLQLPKLALANNADASTTALQPSF